MKWVLITFSLVFSLSIFCQKDNEYDLNYILDGTANIGFVKNVSDSISNIDEIFFSSCFYYIELFKEDLVFVDTFDLLNSQQFALLDWLLANHKKVYGYRKSSYFVPYFEQYTDSSSLDSMNKILDNANFKSKYYSKRYPNNIKRLNSRIYKRDSLLMKDFLSLLPDSIKDNKTGFKLHQSMLTDSNYVCNLVGEMNGFSKSDLVIDLSSYSYLNIFRPTLSFWCKENSKIRICYHINLINNDNRRLKRAIRKHFDLKRKEIRRGGCYDAPYGNTVIIYTSL